MKNETITAKANQSKRTFTIRKYIDGKLFAKYRTFEMSDDDFFAEEMNTENDYQWHTKRIIELKNKLK